MCVNGVLSSCCKGGLRLWTRSVPAGSTACWWTTPSLWWWTGPGWAASSWTTWPYSPTEWRIHTGRSWRRTPRRPSPPTALRWKCCRTWSLRAVRYEITYVAALRFRRRTAAMPHNHWHEWSSWPISVSMLNHRDGSHPLQGPHVWSDPRLSAPSVRDDRDVLLKSPSLKVGHFLWTPSLLLGSVVVKCSPTESRSNTSQREPLGLVCGS